MASKELIVIKPGRGLESGVYPSAEPSVGTIWKTAVNAWFRDLHIEGTPGRTRIVSNISRGSKCLAQAWVNGKARLYYEDGGIVYYYENGAPNIIGQLDPAGTYSFEPYGEWLIASDNINPLKIWKNSGSFVAAGDAGSIFSTAKIVKKLAQHVLVYNTDVYPSGFHWCSASNPELWTPSAVNSAGDLPIRDLDSDIQAVADLGAAHGVYSQDYLLIVRYVGPANWFGTPDQALKGIGAVSQHSIVSLGRQNWGLSRGGIFVTDGLSFMYVDRPAIDRWLQENVDWGRKAEVVGYFNDQLQLVVWTVPLLTGGLTSIAVDPRNKSLVGGAGAGGNKAFTFLDEEASFGIDRMVFDYPILAKSDGIYKNSVNSTVSGGLVLETQLLDGGAQDKNKTWDRINLEGTLSGEVRLGFSMTPQFDAVEWNNWQTSEYELNFTPRESIFLALQFRSDEAFKLSGITVFGEIAGLQS